MQHAKDVHFKKLKKQREVEKILSTKANLNQPDFRIEFERRKDKHVSRQKEGRQRKDRLDRQRGQRKDTKPVLIDPLGNKYSKELEMDQQRAQELNPECQTEFYLIEQQEMILKRLGYVDGYRKKQNQVDQLINATKSRRPLKFPELTRSGQNSGLNSVSKPSSPAKKNAKVSSP